MLTKATLKSIRSLEQKKTRDETGLFLAEGHKLVDDLLPLLPCRMLLHTSDWQPAVPLPPHTESQEVSQETLERASLLRNPQAVLGVFEQPNIRFKPEDVQRSLLLALDTIQDPGNMGTILRIADWFGIKRVLCSPGTVDVYNPKVVQASMGAIGRIEVLYTELTAFLPATGMPVFGTFLEGEPIALVNLPAEGIIVMGNEGNGISPEVEACVTRKLHIPAYPPGASGSESLNVAVATAIVCHEFRRNVGK